eukprot:CAMPEP_0113912552 /NCGR_PEP_ID=MMETSP0780_2-20120614/28995_1 /TAXON_ID=652834 /ORGANISM="Palpitomonas bilix" /LENGTH=467 /DNA_ID=CAMNT_0000909533 /DNA_START=364 /DNA_END=1767 /DNA_ORIENTATION=+ /assembly_acc=CAM_ASM_000599
MTFKESLLQYSETLLDFIPYCEYKGDVCDPSSVVETFDIDYGRCYTFVPPVGQTISRPGEKDKLLMILNIQSDRYLGLQPNSGAKMVVHNANVPPIPNTGIALKPGSLTQVAIARREIVSINNEDCYFDIFGSLSKSCEDLPLNVSYSVSQCYRDCEGTIIEQYCNCTAAGYVSSTNPSLPECKLSDFSCMDAVRSYFDEHDEAVGLQPNSGAKMVVHNANVPPIPNTGIALKPGSLTQVAIARREIVSINNEDCYFDIFGSLSKSCEDLPLNVSYSVSQCYRDCEGTIIEQYCNCTAAGYVSSTNPSLPECKLSDFSCMDAVRSYFDEHDEAVAECNCLERCNVVEYLGTPSSFNYPAPSYAKHFLSTAFPDSDAIDFEQDAIILEVFFRDLNSEIVKESWSYTPTSLLSDLGGNMGLFVGFSILTLFELAEFFVRCCMAARHGKRGDKFRQKKAAQVVPSSSATQ